jgi:hypothetical protein
MRVTMLVVTGAVVTVRVATMIIMSVLVVSVLLMPVVIVTMAMVVVTMAVVVVTVFLMTVAMVVVTMLVMTVVIVTVAPAVRVPVLLIIVPVVGCVLPRGFRDLHRRVRNVLLRHNGPDRGRRPVSAGAVPDLSVHDRDQARVVRVPDVKRIDGGHVFYGRELAL